MVLQQQQTWTTTMDSKKVIRKEETLTYTDPDAKWKEESARERKELHKDAAKTTASSSWEGVKQGISDAATSIKEGVTNTVQHLSSANEARKDERDAMSKPKIVEHREYKEETYRK